LGMFVFALSTFTPTQRFGTLMLVMLMTALLGDLVLLPALLAGPLGRWFRRREPTPDAHKPPSSLVIPAVVLGNTNGSVSPGDHEKPAAAHAIQAGPPAPKAIDRSDLKQKSRSRD